MTEPAYKGKEPLPLSVYVSAVAVPIFSLPPPDII